MATQGTEVVVECVAAGGSPPPGLQWSLGGERLQGEEEVREEAGVTASIVRLPVARAHHKQELRCQAVHEALTRTMDAATTLDIQCKLHLRNKLINININCLSQRCVLTECLH